MFFFVIHSRKIPQGFGYSSSNIYKFPYHVNVIHILYNTQLLRSASYVFYGLKAFVMFYVYTIQNMRDIKQTYLCTHSHYNNNGVFHSQEEKQILINFDNLFDFEICQTILVDLVWKITSLRINIYRYLRIVEHLITRKMYVLL